MATINESTPAFQVSTVRVIPGDILSIPSEKKILICQQNNVMSRRAHGLSADISRVYNVDPYTIRTGSGNTADLSSRPPVGTNLICETDHPNKFVACLFAQYGPGKSFENNFELQTRATNQSPGWREMTKDTAAQRARNFETCLRNLPEDFEEYYFPLGIGCGLAGGQWKRYRRLIEKFAPNKSVFILELVSAPRIMLGTVGDKLSLPLDPVLPDQTLPSKKFTHHHRFNSSKPSPPPFDIPCGNTYLPLTDNERYILPKRTAKHRTFPPCDLSYIQSLKDLSLSSKPEPPTSKTQRVFHDQWLLNQVRNTNRERRHKSPLPFIPKTSKPRVKKEKIRDIVADLKIAKKDWEVAILKERINTIKNKKRNLRKKWMLRDCFESFQIASPSPFQVIPTSSFDPATFKSLLSPEALQMNLSSLLPSGATQIFGKLEHSIDNANVAVNTVMQKVGTVTDRVETRIDNTANRVGNAADSVTVAVGDMRSTAADCISSISSVVMRADDLLGGLTTFVQNATSNLEGMKSGLILINNLTNMVVNHFSKSSVITGLINVVLTMGLDVKTIVSSITSLVTTLWNHLQGALQAEADIAERMEAFINGYCDKGVCAFVGSILFCLLTISVKKCLPDLSVVMTTFTELGRMAIGVKCISAFLIEAYRFFEDKFYVWMHGMSKQEKLLSDLLPHCKEWIINSNLILNYTDDHITHSAEACRQIKLTKKYGDKLIQLARGTVNRELSVTLLTVQKKNIELFDKALRSPCCREVVRPKPFTVYISGLPGQGKTELVKLIASRIIKELLRERARDGYDQNIYSRTTEDFWSGYNGQLICKFDDFLAVKDSANAPNVNVSEMISAANTEEWNLNMASLEQKGSTFFTSEFILVTSNNEVPQTASLNCPGALYRRFDLCFRVSANDNVLTNNVIDPAKLETDSDGAPVPYQTGFYSLEQYSMEAGNAHPVNVRAPISYQQFWDVLKQNHKKLVVENETKTNYFRNMHGGGDLKEPLPDTRKFHDGLQMGLESTEELEAMFDRAVANTRSLTDNVTIEQILDTLNSSAEAPEVSTDSLGLASVAEPSIVYSLTSTDHLSLVTRVEAFIERIRPKVTASNVAVAVAMFSVLTAAIMTRKNCPLSKVTQPEDIPVLQTSCSCDTCKIICARQASRSDLLRGNLVAAFDILTHIITRVPDVDKKFVKMYAQTVAALGVDAIVSKFPTTTRIQSPNTPLNILAQSGDLTTIKKCPPILAQSGDMSTVKKAPPIFASPPPHQAITSQIQGLCQEALQSSNTLDSINYVVPNNVVTFVAINEAGVSADVHAMFVRNNVLITNKHAWNWAHSSFCLKQPGGTAPFMLVPKEQCSVVNYQRYGNHYDDLLLIKLPKPVINKKDILNKFVTRAQYKDTYYSKIIVAGFRKLKQNGQTTQVYTQLGPVDYKIFEKVKVIPHAGGTVQVTKSIEYPLETVTGDCGMPIFTTATTQGKIIGMHFASWNGVAMGVTITREDLEFGLSQFGEALQSKVDDFPNLPITYAADVPLPVNCETVLVLGTSQPVHQPIRSDIKHSLLHSAWMNYTTPSHLGKFTNKAGDVVDPVAKGVQKFAKKSCHVPEILLQLSELSVSRLVFEKMTEPRSLFTWDEVIHGKGIVKPIERSTSPGLPWTRTPCSSGKKLWFGSNNDWIDDHPDILSAYAQMKKQAQEDAPLNVLNFACLKDERLPIEKADRKSRMFVVTDQILNLLIREYYGEFINQFQTQHVHVESAVGVNVYSRMWGKVASDMKLHDHYTAWDYADFDGRQSSDFGLAIARIVNRWYDDGEENARVRISLIKEIFNPYILIEGVVYRFDGVNTSGNSMTVITNSLFNMLYIRSLWFYFKYEEGLGLHDDFRQNVQIFVFGDDGIMSSCVPEFIASISRISQGFGLEMTSCDKTGPVRPMLFEELDFLKRKFVYDSSIGLWRCPLQIQVITEMVLWVRKPSSYAHNLALTVDNIQTSLFEASIHGAELYNKYAAALTLEMKERDIYTSTYIPAYIEQVQKYLSCGLSYDLSYTAAEALQMNVNSESESEVDDPCPICMGNIKTPIITSCKHEFCSSCLITWKASQENRPSCPVCRAPLPTDEVRRLFSGCPDPCGPNCWYCRYHPEGASHVTYDNEGNPFSTVPESEIGSVCYCDSCSSPAGHQVYTRARFNNVDGALFSTNPLAQICTGFQRSQNNALTTHLAAETHFASYPFILHNTPVGQYFRNWQKLTLSTSRSLPCECCDISARFVAIFEIPTLYNDTIFEMTVSYSFYGDKQPHILMVTADVEAKISRNAIDVLGDSPTHRRPILQPRGVHVWRRSGNLHDFEYNVDFNLIFKKIILRPQFRKSLQPVHRVDHRFTDVELLRSIYPGVTDEELNLTPNVAQASLDVTRAMNSAPMVNLFEVDADDEASDDDDMIASYDNAPPRTSWRSLPVIPRYYAPDRSQDRSQYSLATSFRAQDSAPELAPSDPRFIPQLLIDLGYAEEESQEIMLAADLIPPFPSTPDASPPDDATIGGYEGSFLGLADLTLAHLSLRANLQAHFNDPLLTLMHPTGINNTCLLQCLSFVLDEEISSELVISLAVQFKITYPLRLAEVDRLIISLEANKGVPFENLTDVACMFGVRFKVWWQNAFDNTSFSCAKFYGTRDALEVPILMTPIQDTLYHAVLISSKLNYKIPSPATVSNLAPLPDVDEVPPPPIPCLCGKFGELKYLRCCKTFYCLPCVNRFYAQRFCACGVGFNKYSVDIIFPPRFFVFDSIFDDTLALPTGSEFVGEGNFGAVYSNGDFVIKHYKCNPIDDVCQHHCVFKKALKVFDKLRAIEGLDFFAVMPTRVGPHLIEFPNAGVPLRSLEMCEADCVRLYVFLASACKFLWGNGLIHHDIKDDNILAQLSDEGEIERFWLIDFDFCDSKFNGDGAALWQPEDMDEHITGPQIDEIACFRTLLMVSMKLEIVEMLDLKDVNPLSKLDKFFYAGSLGFMKDRPCLDQFAAWFKSGGVRFDIWQISVTDDITYVAREEYFKEPIISSTYHDYVNSLRIVLKKLKNFWTLTPAQQTLLMRQIISFIWERHRDLFCGILCYRRGLTYTLAVCIFALIEEMWKRAPGSIPKRYLIIFTTIFVSLNAAMAIPGSLLLYIVIGLATTIARLFTDHTTDHDSAIQVQALIYALGEFVYMLSAYSFSMKFLLFRIIIVFFHLEWARRGLLAGVRLHILWNVLAQPSWIGLVYACVYLLKDVDFVKLRRIFRVLWKNMLKFISELKGYIERKDLGGVRMHFANFAIATARFLQQTLFKGEVQNMPSNCKPAIGGDIRVTNNDNNTACPTEQFNIEEAPPQGLPVTAKLAVADTQHFALEEIVSRPVLIKAVMTKSNMIEPFQTLTPLIIDPNVLFKDPVIKNKLVGFRDIEATVRLTINFSLSKFVVGSMVGFVYPEWFNLSPTAQATKLHYPGVMNLGLTEIDFSTATSLTLDMPMISLYDSYSLLSDRPIPHAFMLLFLSHIRDESSPNGEYILGKEWVPTLTLTSIHPHIPIDTFELPESFVEVEGELIGGVDTVDALQMNVQEPLSCPSDFNTSRVLFKKQVVPVNSTAISETLNITPFMGHPEGPDFFLDHKLVELLSSRRYRGSMQIIIVARINSFHKTKLLLSYTATDFKLSTTTMNRYRNKTWQIGGGDIAEETNQETTFQIPWLFREPCLPSPTIVLEQGVVKIKEVSHGKLKIESLVPLRGMDDVPMLLEYYYNFQFQKYDFALRITPKNILEPMELYHTEKIFIPRDATKVVVFTSPGFSAFGAFDGVLQRGTNFGATARNQTGKFTLGGFIVCDKEAGTTINCLKATGILYLFSACPTLTSVKITTPTGVATTGYVPVLGSTTFEKKIAAKDHSGVVDTTASDGPVNVKTSSPSTVMNIYKNDGTYASVLFCTSTAPTLEYTPILPNRVNVATDVKYEAQYLVRTVAREALQMSIQANQGPYKPDSPMTLARASKILMKTAVFEEDGHRLHVIGTGTSLIVGRNADAPGIQQLPSHLENYKSCFTYFGGGIHSQVWMGTGTGGYDRTARVSVSNLMPQGTLESQMVDSVRIDRAIRAERRYDGIKRPCINIKTPYRADTRWQANGTNSSEISHQQVTILTMGSGVVYSGAANDFKTFVPTCPPIYNPIRVDDYQDALQMRINLPVLLPVLTLIVVVAGLSEVYLLDSQFEELRSGGSSPYQDVLDDIESNTDLTLYHTGVSASLAAAIALLTEISGKIGGSKSPIVYYEDLLPTNSFNTPCIFELLSLHFESHNQLLVYRNKPSFPDTADSRNARRLRAKIFNETWYNPFPEMNCGPELNPSDQEYFMSDEIASIRTHQKRDRNSCPSITNNDVLHSPYRCFWDILLNVDQYINHPPILYEDTCLNPEYTIPENYTNVFNVFTYLQFGMRGFYNDFPDLIQTNDCSNVLFDLLAQTLSPQVVSGFTWPRIRNRLSLWNPSILEALQMSEVYLLDSQFLELIGEIKDIEVTLTGEDLIVDTDLSVIEGDLITMSNSQSLILAGVNNLNTQALLIAEDVDDIERDSKYIRSSTDKSATNSGSIKGSLIAIETTAGAIELNVASMTAIQTLMHTQLTNVNAVLRDILTAVETPFITKMNEAVKGMTVTNMDSAQLDFDFCEYDPFGVGPINCEGSEIEGITMLGVRFNAL